MDRHSLPRVLCISPFFSPLANAEAFCGGKLVLNLRTLGIDVTVLAVDYTRHPKFSNDRSDVWSALQPVVRAIPPSGGWSNRMSPLLGLRYLTLAWSRWIAASVALARELHAEKPFDIVYSRSLPNFAHLSAYWIAQALELPWVANVNDPWDLEGTHLLPQDRDRRPRTFATALTDVWLGRVLRRVDVVTFPCARLRDYQMRLTNRTTAAHVVPHVGHSAQSLTSSRFFSLVHAGNLGTGESTRRNTTVALLRAIRLFLEARPDAARFRLVLVGPEDRSTMALAKELKLNEHLVCTGRVSYAESLEHIAASTVCLLVEGNMPEGIFLPSKFADYITAARPVIALSPATGTIADLGGTQGVTLAPVDDAAGIERAISNHYDAFVNGRIASFAPDLKLRELYDGRHVAEQLATVFQQAIDARAHFRRRAAHLPTTTVSASVRD